MKTVFHVDMDAFFVSVEEQFNPELKGKPVVVGGRPDQRGVVSAASYAARKFGVHSAMPLRTAAKLCPEAIFVPGHPERYREYSGRVFEVLSRFSPLVEMASIDEAYMDMTGTRRLLGPPLAAARKLHDAVGEATGLNCSIGISATRLVAKVASDQAKPNGMLYVLPGLEAQFLAPLAIRRIPGIGKATEANLMNLGIRTAGDLARLDDAFLGQHFGQWGVILAAKARGQDAGGWYDEEIGADTGPKSISHEVTFSQDTADRALIESTLARLAEMVGRRLREHRLYTRTVQIKLRDNTFHTITRAVTLGRPTQLDIELIAESRRLFREHWPESRLTRLVGVQAGALTAGEGQLSLLEAPEERRWRTALGAVDRIRDRFGESSLKLAGGMRGTFEERVHENPAGLPGKKK
ncbi:MAG: DNA polymerase IV [Acidobacteria bacterium]|nr:DNA polymerase IV [Acidobacteriota bacterium]